MKPDDLVYVETQKDSFRLMEREKAEREYPNKPHLDELPNPAGFDFSQDQASGFVTRAKIFQTPYMDKPETLPANRRAAKKRVIQILERDYPKTNWSTSKTDFIDD